ncbi:zf-HC2 domain-containing protein [bacterium]|nr:zf-HC2 domain-containing protein [bacterium]
MRKQCGKYASWITGYIDGELNASQRQEIKTHLADCSECKGAYLSELRVKKTIKERLPIYEAPVTLQRRIRRQIANSESKPGLRQLLHPIFVYRPLSVSLSLAFLMLLIFLPVYQQIRYQPEALSTSRNVEVNGEIVCLDCEVFSKEGESEVPHEGIHRAGIMTEDHRIWTFVNALALESVLHSRESIRKKARIIGDLFPNARYMYVKNYELL